MDRGRKPPVLLVTVRHSGSHSALYILEQAYHRHAMTEDHRKDVGITQPPLWFCHSEPENMGVIAKRMAECSLLISTMRNPMDVAISWIHRGIPLNQWFRDLWTNLFSLQAAHKGLWLPVDTPDRDMRLNAISERLGVELKTDWAHKGVTTHSQAWKSGMTLDEVAEFYKTLPFEQFGYKEFKVKKVAKKRAAKKTAKKVENSFVFTGDKIGGDDPAWCRIHGYSFKLNGAAIKVSDDVAAKLRTHSHFTEK